MLKKISRSNSSSSFSFAFGFDEFVIPKYNTTSIRAALGCFVLLPLFFGENQEQDLNTLKAVLEQEGVTEEQMIDTIEEMATLGADQEKALIERIRRERGFAPSAQ